MRHFKVFLSFSLILVSIVFGDFNNTEGFDSSYGIWQDGGVDCARTTTVARTGTHSLRLKDGSATAFTQTKKLPLAGLNTLKITLTTHKQDYGYACRFYLHISTDGGTNWVMIKTYRNAANNEPGEWDQESVTWYGDFTDDTIIKISTYYGGTLYLDPISIEATHTTIKKQAITIFARNGREYEYYFWYKKLDIDYENVVTFSCTATFGHRKITPYGYDGNFFLKNEEPFEYAIGGPGTYIAYEQFEERTMPDQVDFIIFYRE